MDISSLKASSLTISTVLAPQLQTTIIEQLKTVARAPELSQPQQTDVLLRLHRVSLLDLAPKGFQLTIRSSRDASLSLKSIAKISRLERPAGYAHASLAEYRTSLDNFTIHVQGGLKGHWAVTVNGNWRLTFTFEGEDAILVDYQDYP